MPRCNLTGHDRIDQLAMFPLVLFCLKSPTVADLTKETFFPFTSSDVTISVVHFYGRNCPACVDSEDTYEELSRMYHQEPRVRFGQLDCDRYSDVCDSVGASDRPAWLVWFPGEAHSKRYNRNIDTPTFERWIRQQTGIWPTSRPNNLLYENTTQLEPMLRKSGCLFTIVDSPGAESSQKMHEAARSLEKSVRRGARFVAVDARENPALAKKLLTADFGAFLHTKGQWVKYEGAPESAAIRSFLADHRCGVVVATPTPTPEPLPELPDLPDEEFVPMDEEEFEDKRDEEETSSDEEWE